MTVKIALRLAGLDLREIEAFERIPEDLAELSFQANGGVSVAAVSDPRVRLSARAPAGRA